MVKRGLKNYFNNIGCFFVLLGFQALGIIIALSIFIPSEINSIKKVASSVDTAIAGGVAQEQLVDFGYKFLDRIKNLSWLKNPVDALGKLLDGGWISTNIKECLVAAKIDPNIVEAINNNIQAAANVFTKESTDQLIAFAITTGVVTLIGYVVTRTYIHFSVINDRNPLHFVFSELLNILVFAGVTMLGIKYLPSNPKLFWLIIVSMFIVELIGAILIAWLVYGRKRIKLGEILKFKKLIKSIAICVLSLAITGLIIYLIYRFGNIISCICISIPLIIITMTIIDVNITFYVIELANAKDNDIDNKKLAAAK